VSEAVRAEHERTDYILSHGPLVLLAALARMAVRRPRALSRALGLATRLGSPGVRGRLWPFGYLIEAAYLAERLATLGVQHLHDHIAEGSASVALLASELSGVPYSVTVHGPGEFDHPEALAFDLKLARAAFFVAISNFARAQLLRWARPEDWNRVHVVPCGVERRFLEAAAGPPPSAQRLVSIGRLDGQKGQLLLLDAMARLRNAGLKVELTLVGDGPLRAQLERAAADLGVREQVHFSGWLDAAGVRDAIAAARALVMPSLAEGLPIVVMEALALGRPVIATDVGALAELVEPGVTGWLVDAMTAAVTAPAEENARLGTAGAERVRERHDSARVALTLEELFRESAARGKR
jgi:glycosyltransferase involved in cell wall biosynthesis